jgi:predicted Zn-dependent protease
MTRGLLSIGSVVVALCLGCSPPNQEGPGHRSQTLALTPQQEVTLGRKAYEEILAKSDVASDGPEVERVRRVGTRIAHAAQIKPLQREINLHLEGYEFDWKMNVLRDRQVNAFCLPGGEIGVYTGLLQLVGDNDDQLATVLSHEVAHALAHHASERIAREEMTEHALRAVNGALGGMDPATRKHLIGLLAGGAEVNSLKYDRRQESEADHIGLFLMTFAGYDPDQALVFWEKMERLSERRGHPPAILSTHPTDAQRIKQMREWIPQAKAAKKAFDEGRIAPARGR